MSSCSCSCTRRRRPSAALVVATLALFLSLGGTSYAALKAGSVGSKQLASQAVTTQKIRPGAVTATRVGTGAVATTKIRNAAVTSSKLGRGSVTGAKIARDAVTSQSVLDGSLGGQDIARGSLGSQHIAAGSLDSRSLSADVVTRLGGLWALGDRAHGGVEQQVSTTGFTTVRSLSVSSVHAGSTLLEAQAAVRADTRADVVCSLVRIRSGVPTDLSNAPMTVPAGTRTVVPASAIADLAADDVVQLRCSTHPGATAYVDLDPARPTSTLAAVRIGPR